MKTKVKPIHILIAVFILLEILDCSMTLWMLKHGYVESNPYMAWVVSHPLVSWLVSLATCLVVGGLLLLVHRCYKWLAYIPAAIAIIFKAKSVIHNVLVFFFGIHPW